MYSWWWKPGYYSWWWPSCFPFLLIFILAFIFLMFRRSDARNLGAGPGQTPPRPEVEDSALEIVKKRYARGDLTREEFETLRKDLSS